MFLTFRCIGGSPLDHPRKRAANLQTRTILRVACTRVHYRIQTALTIRISEIVIPEQNRTTFRLSFLTFTDYACNSQSLTVIPIVQSGDDRRTN